MDLQSIIALAEPIRAGQCKLAHKKLLRVAGDALVIGKPSPRGVIAFVPYPPQLLDVRRRNNTASCCSEEPQAVRLLLGWVNHYPNVAHYRWRRAIMESA